EVKTISGNPYKNYEEISGTGFLSEGDQLSTNIFSEALITIPDIGTVALGKNSSLKRDGEYSLTLEKGTITTDKKNAAELLKVSVGSADIQDYYPSGSYTLTTNNEEIILDVTRNS